MAHTGTRSVSDSEENVFRLSWLFSTAHPLLRTPGQPCLGQLALTSTLGAVVQPRATGAGAPSFQLCAGWTSCLFLNPLMPIVEVIRRVWFNFMFSKSMKYKCEYRLASKLEVLERFIRVRILLK